jgi:hypothetical protein
MDAIHVHIACVRDGPSANLETYREFQVHRELDAATRSRKSFEGGMRAPSHDASYQAELNCALSAVQKAQLQFFWAKGVQGGGRGQVALRKGEAIKKSDQAETMREMFCKTIPPSAPSDKGRLHLSSYKKGNGHLAWRDETNGDSSIGRCGYIGDGWAGTS